MTSADVPADWPTVGPVRRVVRWLLGTGMGLQTLVLVASPAIGLPEGRPVWVVVPGLVIVVPSLGYGWWMLARGTMRQVISGVRPGDAGSWSERMRLRRTLLAGGELDGDERRRIAVELTALSRLRWAVALLGSVAGTNLATSSSIADGSTYGTAMLVLGAVPVLILLSALVMLLWLWPVRRAAAAIGALPAVVDGPHVTTA